VSYLFKKITALPGRSHKGRMYYPGCDETSVDADGRVSSGKQTGLYAMSTAWLSVLTGTIGVTPEVLHTASSDADEVLDLRPQSVVATQRRRLRRGL
jgi:hypothetical protein